MFFSRLKLLLIALYAYFGVGMLCAQEPLFPFIRNQMTLSVSYSRNEFFPNKVLQQHQYSTKLNGCDISLMYGVNNWIETGVVVDVGYGSRFMDESLIYLHSPSVQGYCGQAARAHLLAAIWPEFSLFDVYVSGIIGVDGTYCMRDWPKPRIGLLSQFGIGMGFNFGRHFGFGGEYGINTRGDNYVLFGFNIRFAGPKKWQK